MTVRKLYLGLVLFILAMFGLVALLAGYVFPYFADEKTQISGNEIVIARVTGFGRLSTYALNTETREEKLLDRTFIPFVKRRYVSVERQGECECVTRVYWASDDTHFSVTREADKVDLTTGYMILTSKTISLAQVQDKFDAGQRLLDEARGRFAHLLPK